MKGFGEFDLLRRVAVFLSAEGLMEFRGISCNLYVSKRQRLAGI